MEQAIPGTNGKERSPVSPAEVAGVRTETKRASLLPPHVYHDPEVLAYEQEAWFAGGWVCVGREEDILLKGQYFLTKLCNENVIVVRDDEGEVRAFFNFCRHRGSTLVEEPAGQVPRFQCPYHAWIYDLDGSLHMPRFCDMLEDFSPDEWGLVPVNLGLWQGLIFLNVTGDAPPLYDYLDDMPEFFERFDLGALRRASLIEYDVKANWKAIIENYSECYHCPGVHPQLNKITPFNMGDWIPTDGPWRASWMPVVGDYDTLTMDGQMTEHGRDFLDGITEDDHKKVYYFVIWPNLLISLHPDYQMTHRVVPIEPGRTYIACEWFFDPEDMARPDFDPSDAVEFWDLTNRQDWHVCELQQAGTASRAYTAGRYTGMESGVHSFDIKVADRYANDGVTTRLNEISKTEASQKLAGRIKSRVVSG
jgi:phenylpropionate dioxygenase-like ring-hydroxylating dioxygenase large terminal subunit